MYSNPKNKEQVFYRVNHATQLVQRICRCPTPFPRVPTITFYTIDTTGGLLANVFFQQDSDPLTTYVLKVYGSNTSPVTSSDPVVAQTSGNTSPLSIFSITPVTNAYLGIQVIATNIYGNSTASLVITYTVPVPPPSPFTFLIGGTTPSYRISGSYDSVAWSHSSIVGDSSIGVVNSLTYSSDSSRWIAVGDTSGSTPTAIVSNDGGLNWSASGFTNFFNQTGFGIAYGNSFWFAVGQDSTRFGALLKSSNGINWTTILNVFGTTISAYGRSVFYNGFTWIAVGTGDAGGIIVRSDDDWATWTTYSTGNFVGFDVVFGNGVWVTVGSPDFLGNTIYRSVDDGLTWSPVSGGFSILGRGIGFNPTFNQFIAAGEDATHSLKSSLNGGVTWSNIGAPNEYFPGGANAVLYHIPSATWIACGNNTPNSNVMYSLGGGGIWFNSTGDVFSTGIPLAIGST